MWHDISVKWYDFPDSICTLYISYNLSDMYYLAFKNAWYDILSFWEYINWKKLKDLQKFLIDFRNELESKPKKYKKMNPENWWWSYDWLLRNINLLIVASYEKPNWTLYDSY